VSAVRAVEPLTAPPEAVVHLPGSKSITNRALLAAALARGSSTLHRALDADDTFAMKACLRGLGIAIEQAKDTLVVNGCGGELPVDEATLDARQSGTTARFVLPVLATGRGRYTLDGHTQLRLRPMVDGVDALRALGARVSAAGIVEHLPIEVSGGPVWGGRVSVAGTASSQFLSGMLLVGPVLRNGLEVVVSGDLVSRPYVTMTTAVMSSFGASVEQPDESTWVVAPTGYDSTTYDIEPDASAASYFFAAAAITGGRVSVEGLGTRSLQGDLAFVDVVESMGAEVERTAERTTVIGGAALHGIDVDLRDASDTVPTLAVVAAFAEGPTRITGVGFIRGKESNRIEAVVTELRRLGVDAEEEADGLVVRPGPSVQPGRVATYDDHRMAMAFALAGLRVDGIEIEDPDCVSKTLPSFWSDLDQLRRK
jgi:3-phosphoshikimate 1-carboxyvinyltransferase